MVQARRFLITLETLVVLLMGLMGAVVYLTAYTGLFAFDKLYSQRRLVAGFAGMAVYHALLVAPRDLAEQRGQQRGLQP